MFALHLMPAILSLLLLAAHFLRRGDVVIVVLVLALLGLMAVPRAWAARILQGALVLGAIEWVRTLVVLASARAQAGLPAARLVLILGAVVVLTGASVFVFRGARARSWYRSGSGSPSSPGPPRAG
jgi:hypothetical protein